MSANGSGQAAPRSFELVLVGGGLQNGLIALASLARNPARRIALVEAGETLGGNHTWSLHAQDVPAAARAFVEPLLVAHFDQFRSEVHLSDRSTKVEKLPFGAEQILRGFKYAALPSQVLHCV